VIFASLFSTLNLNWNNMQKLFIKNR